MTAAQTLEWFAGFGIELEYMIVNRASLNVAPLADRLIERAFGRIVSEFEDDQLCWSNELALHVIEFKTNGPAASLSGLSELFHARVRAANRYLADLNACLMPSAMHPWMNPVSEIQLWPHDYSDVYAAYNRIFGAQGHGWSNLQSVHLNLPFASDEQFVKLHEAVRLVLPLIPALAASSPFVETRWTGYLDNRMRYYEHNQQLIPAITGPLMPESVGSIAAYKQTILEPMYRDISGHDPLRILQHEWLNSRGAIARFERGAIELRVMDIAECPRADLAIISFLVALIRRLCVRPPAVSLDAFELKKIFTPATALGGSAQIQSPAYLNIFSLPAHPITLQDFLRYLRHDWLGAFGSVDRGALSSVEKGAEKIEGELDREALDFILAQGSLAQRLVKRLGASPPRRQLEIVYRELCDCLEENRLFEA